MRMKCHMSNAAVPRRLNPLPDSVWRTLPDGSYSYELLILIQLCRHPVVGGECDDDQAGL
jgi:hypothetical protein